MFIKVTKVIAGSPCVSEYSSHSISMDWAEEMGLFKNSRWISSIHEGETLVINVEVSKRLPEIAAGNFEYEEIEAKYMNQTLYSDTNAFEVIKWVTPKKALLRELKPVFKNGWSESTDEFEQDLTNEIFEVRMHKNGGFYTAGSKCCPFIPTENPHYYYDRSF